MQNKAQEPSKGQIFGELMFYAAFSQFKSINPVLPQLSCRFIHRLTVSKLIDFNINILLEI
jgi:hypothetical protein